MVAADYQYIFQQSAIAQWVIDVIPLHQMLLDKQLHTAELLEQQLQQNQQLIEQLRKKLHIIDANFTTLQLYHCQSVAEFSQFIQLHASDEQIKHLCMAILGASKTSSRYAYQTTVKVIDSYKSLLVHCEVPSLGSFHLGMNVSILDVSSLTEAENELREREQFLEAILKAVPDILLVFDFHQQTTLFQNIDLLERLGYSKEEIADTDNQLMSYIIHPDDGLGKDAMGRIYQTLVEGGIFEVTIRLQHADGQWRHYFFRSAALDKDEDGQLQTAVVVARDVSDIFKTQQSLFEQQRLYRLLAENFTDVIVITDVNLAITYVSPSIGPSLGYDMESFAQLEEPLALLGLGEHCQWLQQLLQRVPERYSLDVADQEAELELNATTAAGFSVPIEMTISILRDEYGWLEGLLIVVRDVSERLKREAENRLAAKVFSNSLEGIYITNADGVIVQVNQAFCDITGFKEQDVLGQKPSQLSSGWRDTRFKTDIEPILSSAGSWSGEIMSRRANGEAFLTWMSITEVRDGRDQLVGIITSFRDITEAKSSEESIRKLAYYDPLTELPNRQLFQDRLSQALQGAKRNQHFVALLFMDLDGFKEINDEYGHAVGDRLLAMVGQRLKACVRSDDTVARMGGDEFTIVLAGQLDRELAESAATQVAKKIIKSLNEVFDIQNAAITVGCSIGIAIYPNDAAAGESLLKYADAAMYHAKSSGKNNYQFYTDDMHKRAQQRLRLEQEILSALAEEEFLLFYQTKIRLQNGAFQGAEALLRWQHPEQGLLAPAQFLDSVNQLGLGHKVGAWVIEQACKHMLRYPELNVSINIFAKHYREGDLYQDVANALQQYDIEPQRLTLEISESLLMADTEYALQLIQELKQLGVRIALDDYASGMLSIGYLNQLPIDEVKIDRQFIAEIDHAVEQLQFVKGVTALAKTFGLTVAAEGIEREQQLDILHSIDCDIVQGYWFNKPLSLSQLAKRYMKK